MRALWRLDQFFALPSDTPAGPEVARHFRRNFLVNAADGVAWLFGSSFVSVNAILPVYASRFTSSAIVIGLIPALTDAGWFLPQLFTAPFVERLSRKKPLVARLAAMERLPYLALPLAALWLEGLPRRTAVFVFLALMVWKSFASGLVANPWQELIATVIPVSHRGRFFGISHLVGQLLGVAGASLAAVILELVAYPRNYALCFALGAVGMLASYAFFMLTREPPPPPATPPQAGPAYLQRLSTILRDNPNFRAFMFSRGLAYLGGMAYGFMALHAVKSFGLPDAQAAVYTAILFGSGVFGYGLWGMLGDRLGHKRVLELSGILWLVALVLALAAPSPGVFNVVFMLMGFGSAGGVLGDLSIAMEFGPEEERPTYIGLARTVTGPVIFAAPILGGALAQAVGYPAMFAVSLVFAVAGLVVLWWKVAEPRHAPTPELSSLPAARL